MPNPNRELDTSYLSADKTDERVLIHRDLIAHSLRWSHIARELQKEKRKLVRLLDIGCGVEAPLAKMMYSNRLTGGSYLGVDVGPINPKMNFGPAFTPMFKDRTDAAELLENVYKGLTLAEDLQTADVQQDFGSFMDALGGLPNYVVSFEVFEHMLPDRLARLLNALARVVVSETRLFFSTPVYDHHVGAASNHINEMTIDTVGTMLEAAGFEIINRWGTFASQKDYKGELATMTELHLPGVTLQCDPGFMAALQEQLKEYYDADLVSILWAPLFPNQSRNNLWEVRKVSVHPDVSGWRQFDTSFKPLAVERGQCLNNQAWVTAADLLGLPLPNPV